MTIYICTLKVVIHLLQGYKFHVTTKKDDGL